MPEIDPQALANLDANSRTEILRWIESENSKSKVQLYMCWKKCIKGDIKSNTLDNKEDSCLQNCLHRFLDVNINVVKLIQESQR